MQRYGPRQPSKRFGHHPLVWGAHHTLRVLRQLQTDYISSRAEGGHDGAFFVGRMWRWISDVIGCVLVGKRRSVWICNHLDETHTPPFFWGLEIQE